MDFPNIMKDKAEKKKFARLEISPRACEFLGSSLDEEGKCPLIVEEDDDGTLKISAPNYVSISEKSRPGGTEG